jgi:hypothetical protein
MWRGPLAAACVFALLGGCGGESPVRLTGVPNPAGAEGAACTALTADLPASLGTGMGRRVLDPPTPFGAAWGAAPAILTCGVVGTAATYRPDAELAVIDDVGWFVERDGDVVRYSTPTRRPQVVLSLPADVQGFDVLVTLAPVVRRHTSPATP